MTFEEAIIESVRQYYKGKDPENYMEARGEDIKYTREYFDKLEAEVLDEPKPKKKAKKDMTEGDDDQA